MVTTIGMFSEPIRPTMQWCIISDTYRQIDWLMGYMCSKYQNEILYAFRTSKRIFFDDGIEINEFRFVNNDPDKLKSANPDIYMDIDDFRKMWLLE